MIVFAGPSIAGLEHPTPEMFEFRAPAQQGDVYLATLDRPAAIGIIDGYFEGVPSVWHKEILWALSQGIAVFGASSMGALRAAELDVFGMSGFGAIYAAYRDGVLEDDDEVAVLHGPAEIGYPALSLAMVNARATLDAALVAGVITASQAQYITDLAKSQFYKSRTWRGILDAADLKTSDRAALEGWIKHHEVDQKQQDAAGLLAMMSEIKFDAPIIDFHFEDTDRWRTAVKSWRHRSASDRVFEGEGYQLLGGLGLSDE